MCATLLGTLAGKRSALSGRVTSYDRIWEPLVIVIVALIVLFATQC